ncbi:MAG: T9SS type A sorting domain-containing protein [Bacteroidota bacterium]
MIKSHNAKKCTRSFKFHFVLIASIIFIVNNSYSQIESNVLNEKSIAASLNVAFDLCNSVDYQDSIDIPVSISSTVNIQGLDFIMQFDETKITFVTIIDKTTYLDEYFSLNAVDRKLRLTSTSSVSGGFLEADKVLIVIRFKKQTGYIVSQSDFNSIQAFVNGDPATVDYCFVSNNEINVSNFLLYPNPASDILNIEVPENSSFQMLDINGKLVVAETAIMANQKQSIDVNNLTNGIYFIKINNDSFVNSKKVVITK